MGVCEQCGEEREDVGKVRNPYLYDKTGEEVDGDYCLDCLEDLRGDI